MGPLPAGLPSADEFPDPSSDGTFHLRPDQVVGFFGLLSYVHEQYALCHATSPQPPIPTP